MAGRGEKNSLKKFGMNFKSTMNVAFGGKKSKDGEASSENTKTMIDKVQSAYPGAMTSVTLASTIKTILAKNGFSEDKTLVATSLCCDEVNRELEQALTMIYGDNFSMGGLAGFAFGGVTSFGAMSHHIPEGGSCLVMYGPHVGVDLEGNVGKVNRRGRGGSGACCGSANAAAAYVKDVRGGKREEQANPEDILDAQQTWVGAQLIPYGERLETADDADVELPLALYDAQNELMTRIVSAGCGEVAGEGLICLLGGIQINTESSAAEYFLPKRFEILNNKGESVADLLSELMA
mmetsp:Transcript_28739/g.44163  ORF Transcript_28739/g.44163 Transcript_28739/m.44163 type:complete len:293 (+) Transcript_28739:200-1078(+)